MRRSLVITLLVCVAIGFASASTSDSPSPPINNAHSFAEAMNQLTDPATVGRTDTPSGPPPYPCYWTAPDGTYFDFSSLTTPTGTVVNGDQSDAYNINVCGIGVGDPTAGNCQKNSATVCFQFTWSPTWFALAEYTDQPVTTPPAYSLIGSTSAGGVQMTFNNGVYANNKVTLVMQFLCKTDALQPVYTAQHQTQYQWLVTVTAAACCPTAPPSPPDDGGGSSKHGLSGGWAFIIFLLCLTVVYVVGGCAYKHYRKGTQGMESCPNVDFWRELPGLVKDGCIFFAIKCKAGIARCQGKSNNSSDYNNFK